MTDFGLARLPEDKHDLTQPGDELGTLRYMSPEQLGGGRGSVDARTEDIYGLGVTLYELLTLQPLFGRDRHELRLGSCGMSQRPPRRLNPSMPRDLETVVLKAIEKDPRLDTARRGTSPPTCAGFWPISRCERVVPV